MARIYIDTSFISACVSTRVDPASVYRRATSLQWLESERSKHEVGVSAEVFAELDNSNYPNRAIALSLAETIPLLEIDQRCLAFASVLVKELVMPGPVTGDAVHVAVACLHQCEFLLSWNIRHLANPNKVVHLRTVCLRAGYLSPSIITPESLWSANQ